MAKTLNSFYHNCYILRFCVSSVNNPLRSGRQGQVSVPQGGCGQHGHQGNRDPQALGKGIPLEQGMLWPPSAPWELFNSLSSRGVVEQVIKSLLCSISD